MALTRKLLKGMGLTDEQVDTIIEAHTDTVDGLKADIGRYKTDAEKLPGVQKELDDLKAGNGEDYKAKYEKEHSDFDQYKKDVAAKESHTAKENAYRELLKAAGISDARIGAVLKVSDVDSVELVDGKIKDADKLTESIKTEWKDFVVTTRTKGANTANPPANTGAKMTREQITAIKDPT